MFFTSVLVWSRAQTLTAVWCFMELTRQLQHFFSIGYALCVPERQGKSCVYTVLNSLVP